MVFIIIAIVVVFIVFLFIKNYKFKYDTVILYTGGNGSGKSLLSCKTAIKLLKRNRRKVFFYNYFKRFIKFWNIQPKMSKPLMYSNLPVRISRREWSVQLKNEHLLLQSSLIPMSVVFIDEINLLISQMDYKGFKGEKTLNEFVTLFRHYTFGGFLILNTQNVNKVHWVFRYCSNFAFNLSYCRSFILPFIKRVDVRKISIGDDIKSIETDDAGVTMYTKWLFINPFKKLYDTYAYSDFYKTVPFDTNFNHNQYKSTELRSLLDSKDFNSKTNR